MRYQRTYHRAVGALLFLLAGLCGAEAQPAPSFMPGCVYHATPFTLADKQTSPWQCDINGKLITTGAGGGGGIVAGTTTVTGVCANGSALINNAGVVGCQAFAGGGTVTSVSVVSANGLAGTVATATTTPAITLSTTITGILQGNGTAISAATTTGTGSVVLATSPTLVTPVLGAATGTSLTLGGAAVPTISSTSTFTNKTMVSSTNVLGGVQMTLGLDANGDIYYRAAGVLTRLGIGTAGQCLVTNGGATAPEWTTCPGAAGSDITVGTTTITGGSNLNILRNNAGVVGEYAVTGTGNVVMSTNAVMTTPTIGVATATSVNKVTITAPATSATLTLIDGTTLTGPAASGTVMTLGNAETVSSIKTFVTGQIINGTLRLGTTSSVTGQLFLANSTSAFLTTIQAGVNVAAVTYTWPTNVGAAGSVLTDPAGNGVLAWTAGGTGSPGGATTQLQYNNAGVFGGISQWTTNGTTQLTGSATSVLTLGAITGSTQCLQVDTSGVVSGTGAVCGGGGGTPGGLDTQVQFNNAGAFGGDAGLTYNLTTNVLTVAGGQYVSTSNGSAASPAFRVGSSGGVYSRDGFTTNLSGSGTVRLEAGDRGVGINGELGFGTTNDNTDVRLARVAAGILKINAADGTTGATLQFAEQTAPVGAANAARIYSQDNGAGKTQLMVIFPTGAAVQLAIEP